MLARVRKDLRGQFLWPAIWHLDGEEIECHHMHPDSWDSRERNLIVVVPERI